MLDYAQLNKEVFDPVAGEYYPPSFTEQKAMEADIEKRKSQQSGFRQLMNNLQSIFK